ALSRPGRVPPPPGGLPVGRPAAAARDRAGARGAARRPAPGRALARARPVPGRQRLRRPDEDPRRRFRDPARRAARPANGCARRSDACDRERRAPPDPRPRRRRRHGEDGRGLLRRMSVLAAGDAQTLVDSVGLGAIYALMAVGIGLVFGVLRLVNFAYGQLVMAGAYSLAFAYERGWPVWAGILLCFAVVIVLSVAMDWVVFRPLRTQTPAVMLVATFAVAFLLQSIALLWFGPLGKIAASLSSLNQPWTVGGVDIRKISIVSTAVAAGCLVALVLLLGRTSVGLQMRAAALDFRPARLLGGRAHR